eukprot:756222-Hanusia_phi.AAC.2
MSGEDVEKATQMNGAGSARDDFTKSINEGHASDGGSEDETSSYASSSSFPAAAAADGLANESLILGGSNVLMGGGSVAWSRRRLREVSSVGLCERKAAAQFLLQERRMAEPKPMPTQGGGRGGKVSGAGGGVKSSRRLTLVVAGLAGDPEIIFNLGGPILFTAPHSLNIVRGGKDGERRRIHKREKFSSEIVLKLAAFLEPYLGKVLTSSRAPAPRV